MKLGITTNVYAGPLKSHEIELEGIIDLAPSLSIRVVEIRDDLASLEEARVKSLVSRAREKGLALTYAIRNDMMAGGDKALFERGAKLASLCGTDCVLRILASQDSLKAEGKQGYSSTDLQKLKSTSEVYGGIASASGVLVAIEHARDPLYGTGGYFGISDLIRGVQSKSVGLTFDPANATNKSLCKSPSTERDVLRFIDELGTRIFMTHYKTTSNGAVQSTLGDADVDNARLLETLSRVYHGVLCIEIPGSATLKETNASLQASVSYLREKGLFRYLE